MWCTVSHVQTVINAIYIGQSGRSLACRMKVHRRAVVGGDMNASAIAEHAWTNHYSVNWEEAKILDVCDRWHERCLLELWHMLNHPERMNRDKGLHYFYFYLYIN